MTPHDLELMASRFRKRAANLRTQAAISRNSSNTADGETTARTYDQWAHDCEWAAKQAEQEAEMERSMGVALRTLARGAGQVA